MLVTKIARMGMAGALTVGIAALAQALPQESNAGQRASTTAAEAAQTGPVTLAGCLVKETDYRQAHNLSEGALGGVGLGDEFVLVDTSVVPTSGTSGATNGPANATASGAAASACAEKGTGPAYRVTGEREDELKALVGRQLEITGTFRKVDADSKLPQEVTMTSYRRVPGAAPAAVAAAPALEPAPAALPEAPVPLSTQARAETPREPSPDLAPRALPATATSDPLIALVGALLLAAGASLWLVPRRT